MSDEPFPGSAADFYERIQEYKGIGERLRESDERLSAALKEIERLETINSSRTFLYLEARSLITELCDALGDCRRFIHAHCCDVPYAPDLEERAREATR